MTQEKKKRTRSPRTREKDRERRLRAKVLKAHEGRCPNCGFIVFSGGPASKSEYPLMCRGPECAQEIQVAEVVIA